MNIGNRVFGDFERVDAELAAKFKGLPSSNINDEMNRLFCMHDYIYLLNPNARQLIGPAFTVKVTSGDNMFFHQALDLAKPGDVLVIDGGSCNNRSLAGEIMLRYCTMKGIAGVIVDGCLRDLDGIQTLDMPVYAKGITPQGPWKNGPGEIGAPIACGGQVVFPGDLLVGDMDGIVVVRRQDAAAVLESALKKKSGEDKTFELMKSDLAAYAKKHVDQVAKMTEGKNVTVEAKSWADMYGC